MWKTLAVGFVLTALVGITLKFGKKVPNATTKIATAERVDAEFYELDNVSVEKGETLTEVLRKNLEFKDVLKALASIESLRRPSKLKQGDEFIFYLTNHNHAARIDWVFSKDRRVVMRRQVLGPFEGAVGEWQSKILETPPNKTFMFIEGTITSSLWDSGTEAGLPSSHIAGLVDLFAWEVDFSREVRVGHKWRMVVERLSYSGNEPVLGKIVATTYEMPDRSFTAVRWDGNEKVPSGYFSPNGESLRRMFLKSPISYARISSRFNRSRFHPILKVNKPHLGVDYAAKIGTPVKSIGKGRVTHIGYTKFAGNTLKIRHNATYTTAYKHLNGYRRGLVRGAKVDQGEVVAYVGTTGRSTGPHLHFELWKDGKVVDPLSENFPTVDPFPKEYMHAFEKAVRPYLDLLAAETKLAAIKVKDRSVE